MNVRGVGVPSGTVNVMTGRLFKIREGGSQTVTWWKRLDTIG